MFTEWMRARQADRARRGLRRGRRPGRDHPGAGFVGPMAVDRDRRGGGRRSASRACNLKSKLGYDDSLDVFGVHGVGGTWGALATGLFATKAVNEAGADGLFYGNPGQLLDQIVAVAGDLRPGLRRDLRHPQGRRRGRGPAGDRRGRDGRPRPLAALGDRLRARRRVVQRVLDGSGGAFARSMRPTEAKARRALAAALDSTGSETTKVCGPAAPRGAPPVADHPHLTKEKEAAHDPEGCPQAGQGEGRQDRRSPLHRPARPVAALLDPDVRARARASSRTGSGFDGSSIRGFQTIDESDMLLIPDPDHRADGSVHRGARRWC